MATLLKFQIIKKITEQDSHIKYKGGLTMSM